MFKYLNNAHQTSLPSLLLLLVVAVTKAGLNEMGLLKGSLTFNDNVGPGEENKSAVKCWIGPFFESAIVLAS